MKKITFLCIIAISCTTIKKTYKDITSLETPPNQIILYKVDKTDLIPITNLKLKIGDKVQIEAKGLTKEGNETPISVKWTWEKALNLESKPEKPNQALITANSEAKLVYLTATHLIKPDKKIYAEIMVQIIKEKDKDKVKNKDKDIDIEKDKMKTKHSVIENIKKTKK